MDENKNTEEVKPVRQPEENNSLQAKLNADKERLEKSEEDLETLAAKIHSEENTAKEELAKDVQEEKADLEKARAEFQQAGEQARQKLDRMSRNAGRSLEEFNDRLNAEVQEAGKEIDADSDSFVKKAEERFNDFRASADQTIDSFANEMQQDPKKALIDGLKAGLMIIGAIALIKGLFRK